MKKIYLLFLLTILSLNLFCQINWTIHPDPVLEPGPAGSWDQTTAGMPSVLLADDTLRMWYSGKKDNTWAIGYATSTDGGMTWTKYDHNPVLEVGPVGSWDDNYVYYATVLYHESTYHMWYNGQNISEIEATGYATSPDGIHWTKYEGNPIDIGGGGVLFKDNLYHIWSTDGGDYYINADYASSEDGINWTKYEGNPVMESGSLGSWDWPRAQPNSVIFDGQKFHLWYSGGEGGSSSPFQIGYAISPDGINWTKYGNPVIPLGSSGSMGDEYTFFPSVIFDDSNSLYKMWYQAEPGGIAYAESGIYVGIPDTAFLYALIDEGVDINMDSLISFEEAVQVTKLELGDKGISDLTGIEAFLYLDTLLIAENSLTSLDFFMSLSLKVLDASSNNISDIDVSGNSELETLLLSSNSLTVINLKSNTKLKTLAVDSNPGLKKLSIDDNPELEVLWCQKCDLTELNTNNNPALTELLCNDNKITRIVVSKSTALKHLMCSNNQLNSLDVKSNTELNFLRCSGNQLTTLDLSSNTVIGADTSLLWADLELENMPSLIDVCVSEEFSLEGINIATTGSPNICFRINCEGECITTGVNEIRNPGFVIYPNPIKNLFTIETGIPGIYNIDITSINGQLLLKKVMVGTNGELDFSQFKSGVYIVTVRSKDFVTTKKIIKL